MNRAERHQLKKQRRQTARKSEITISAVVGMLESSAHLDELATERRRSEAEKFGRTTGERMEWDGKSYEVVQLEGGHSIGITLSAQIIAGQAAELALKYAFEVEYPIKSAPSIHRLDDLYSQLSKERKNRIERDYSTRKQRHNSPPVPGWETAQEVFDSCRDYPVLFRYATEEGQSPYEVRPILLREAVCSVLASLEVNVRWGQTP